MPLALPWLLLLARGLVGSVAQLLALCAPSCAVAAGGVGWGGAVPACSPSPPCPAVTAGLTACRTHSHYHQSPWPLLILAAKMHEMAPNNCSLKGSRHEIAQPCTPALNCPRLGPWTSQSARPAWLLLMSWHPSPVCTGHGELSAPSGGGRLWLQLILCLSYSGVWALLSEGPQGTVRSGKGKCVSALFSCLGGAGCLDLSPLPSEDLFGVRQWELAANCATGKLSDIAALLQTPRQPLLAREMQRSRLPCAWVEGLFPSVMLH